MIARPVSLLPFHGLMLTVLEAQGVQYVPFRPVVSLLGLDWKMARRTAGTADNAELYGCRSWPACRPMCIWVSPRLLRRCSRGKIVPPGPLRRGARRQIRDTGIPKKRC